MRLSAFYKMNRILKAENSNKRKIAEKAVVNRNNTSVAVC